MAKQNTVFISYRRTNAALALNIYQYLSAQGYDVFYDIASIRGGDWKQIILDNITSRAHFLIVLTPSAAERFSESGDIMRLEIETAIETKRNIVPLFMEEFQFPSVQQHLTGKLSVLPKYNGLPIPMRYFMYAMQDLCNKHLEQDINTIVHPASPQAEEYAHEQQREADKQAPVTQDTLTAQEYYERAWEKEKSGKFDEAIADFTTAIELKPDYTWALNSRGNLKQTHLNDYQGALTDYNQAIQLDPQYTKAYNNRGILKRKHLQDYQGALTDYNQAIQLDPEDAAVYSNRGNLKDDLQDYQGALEDYNQAIQLDSQEAVAYYNRGLLKQDHLNDYQGALDDYNQAIGLNPQEVKAYYNRGLLKQDHLNDYQGALADYSQAIQLDPQYANAFHNRGILKRKHLQDYQGALEDYNQAIQLDPQYADAYINRGALKYNHLQDYQGAKADWERALQINPNDATAKKNLEMVNKKLGNKRFKFW